MASRQPSEPGTEAVGGSSPSMLSGRSEHDDAAKSVAWGVGGLQRVRSIGGGERSELAVELFSGRPCSSLGESPPLGHTSDLRIRSRRDPCATPGAVVGSFTTPSTTAASPGVQAVSLAFQAPGMPSEVIPCIWHAHTAPLKGFQVAHLFGERLGVVGVSKCKTIMRSDPEKGKGKAPSWEPGASRAFRTPRQRR